MLGVLCEQNLLRFIDGLVSTESLLSPPRLIWKFPERKHGTNYFSTECYKT